MRRGGVDPAGPAVPVAAVPSFRVASGRAEAAVGPAPIADFGHDVAIEVDVVARAIRREAGRLVELARVGVRLEDPDDQRVEVRARSRSVDGGREQGPTVALATALRSQVDGVDLAGTARAARPARPRAGPASTKPATPSSAAR